jgi:hypothetical protein
MKALKTSYQLAQMSLSVIRQDLRIIGVHMVGTLILATGLSLIGYALYASGYFQGITMIDDETFVGIVTPASTAALLAASIIGAFVYYFTEAYISSLVLSAIRGERIRLSTAAGKVHKNIIALIQFILLSTTVGVVLRALEEHLPWAGKLATYVALGAWNLGTIFAVTNIVDGNAKTGIEATRKSASLLMNSFGENIAVRISVGSIVSLVFFLWAILIFAGTTAFVVYSVGALFVYSILGIGFVGLVGILFLGAALDSVITVMLYEYVQTGKETSTMNKELFKHMITPKKARAVFTG